MTSLYKRANARQVLVLRIVEGAVRNALHAHPGQQVSERFPRSVAKRAAGTLTAEGVLEMGADTPLSRELVQSRIKNLVTVTASGCWEAKGNRASGYGKIKLNGRRYALHRVAYEVFIGPIPDDLLVRHGCDNSLCCNPEHLEAGTAKQNAEDREARSRSVQRPLKGTIHPRVKLSENAVLAIRSSRETNAATATTFEVSESLVQQIRTGKKWGHLRGGENLSGVLATPFGSSDRGAAANSLSAAPHGSVGGFNDGAAAGGSSGSPTAGAGASERNRRSQLQRLWDQTARKASDAKREGHAGRYSVLVEILRDIAALQQVRKRRVIGGPPPAATLADIWPKMEVGAGNEPHPITELYSNYRQILGEDR